MRILAISKSSPPETNAQSLQTGRVLKAIAETGAEVYLVAGYPSKSQGSAFHRKSDGYVTAYIPTKTPPNSHIIRYRIQKRLTNEISDINPFGKWVTGAFTEAILRLRSTRADLLLTVSTPFHSHIVGLRLKRAVRIPWIASFSDPWPVALTPPPYRTYRLPLLSTLQLHLLRNVLREADAIHMPSKIAVDMVERESGIPISHKSYVIPHIGLQTSSHIHSSGNGWLVHVGHLTRERVSLPLLQAVTKAASEIPGLFKGLCLVGTVCPEFHALSMKVGAQHLVRLLGMVTPEKAMAQAEKSTALLVIEANMPYSPYLPSKFADYAMTGRPIIAITPACSSLSQLLADYGGGEAVHHCMGEIYSAIVNVFRRSVGSNSSGYVRTGALSRLFSPSSIAAQYLALFSNVSKSGLLSNP